MEFYRVLRADALDVKRRLYGKFEEGTLGRLLDIDVVEWQRPTPILRTALECPQDVVSLSAMRKQSAPVLESTRSRDARAYCPHRCSIHIHRKT